MDNKIILKCEECGKERTTSKTMTYHIRAKRCKNRCKSCASLSNENRYLGEVYSKDFYNSPTHKSWSSMKTRCYNKNYPGYSEYGGRGIVVCKRWQEFANFLEDMGKRPKDKTLDRVDNHGDYTPQNCRWATLKEQARNTRNIESAKKYSHKGETLTIREWAEKVGIKRSTLSARLLDYNWDIEKALTH